MDWAYISGFFDADGSLTLIKKGDRVYPSVNFHNTSFELIKELQVTIFKEIDTDGYIYTYIPKNENHQVQYTLKYSYFKTALKVLDCLQPHHPKKKHRKEIVYKI